MKLRKIDPELVSAPDNCIVGSKGIDSVVYHFDLIVSGKPVEPSFVVSGKWFDPKLMESDLGHEPEREEIENFYDSLTPFTSGGYLGIERFHRMIASNLATGKIPALEITSTRDLRNLLRKKLDDYGHEEDRIEDLATSAVNYYWSFRDGLIYSVHELTEDLVATAEEENYIPDYLPERIVKHYRKNVVNEGNARRIWR